MSENELDEIIRQNLKKFAINLLECVRNDIVETADQNIKNDYEWAKGFRDSTRVVDSYINALKGEQK